MDNQAGLSEYGLELGLGSDSLPLNNHRLCAFIQDVVEDDEERVWADASVHSAGVRREPRLGQS